MSWKQRMLAMLAGAGLALGAARAADLPRPSPEFAVNVLGGKQVPLSQYRGRAVALIFILTHCPHCQKTVEMLSKLQAEYGPRGFQALGSAIEDMAVMALPDFLKRYNPPFPVGYNDRPPVIEYLQHPPMLKLLMPHLVFIDKGGAIRAQFAGDDSKFFGDAQEKNIRAQIESLLKNGAAPAAKKTAAAPAPAAQPPADPPPPLPQPPVRPQKAPRSAVAPVWALAMILVFAAVGLGSGIYWIVQATRHPEARQAAGPK